MAFYVHGLIRIMIFSKVCDLFFFKNSSTNGSMVISVQKMYFDKVTLYGYCYTIRFNVNYS